MVAVAEPVAPALPLKPAEIVEEVTQIQTAPAAVENRELPLAEAKAQAEAVLAEHRNDSDRTNEQFDRIRKSMIAKQEQKPAKGKASSLFMKCLRA